MKIHGLDKYYIVNGERTYLTLAHDYMDACVQWFDRVRNRAPFVPFKSDFEVSLAGYRSIVIWEDDEGEWESEILFGPDQVFDISEVLDAWDEANRKYDPFCEFEKPKDNPLDTKSFDTYYGELGEE